MSTFHRPRSKALPALVCLAVFGAGFVCVRNLERGDDTRAETSAKSSNAAETLPGGVAPHPSAPDTAPRLQALDPTQLGDEVALIDRQIDQADFVARANAGQLRGEDFEQFRELLRRRDALQIEKAQRLLARLATLPAQTPSP